LQNCSLSVIHIPTLRIFFISFAYFSSKMHNNQHMSIATQPSAVIDHPPRRGGAVNAPRRKIASRRTTITLTAEAQEIVERFKSASGKSTSAAIDQIIQRSDPKPSRLKVSDIGLLVLDVPFRHVNVTLEDVKRAEDEMDREYVERLMRRKEEPASKGNSRGRRK